MLILIYMAVELDGGGNCTFLFYMLLYCLILCVIFDIETTVIKH